VAGGGLLGLEAAYALHKLGLRTTVLERSPHLLRRQLDDRAGELLRGYLANLGIEVLLEAETTALEDGSAVLADGRRLPADVVLLAAGIAPSVELAQHAGLEVARGVLVDEHLRTSDPRIFAAGDLAEWNGAILGLWPVAVEQAEVAAENAVGGARPYAGTVPVTMLKVVGVELLSIGEIDGPREIADADPEALRYRKVVLDEEGRAVGGILLGHPEHAQALTAAVRESRPMTGWS
jgi:NAD(P)H-nitrite reductase large subunit